MKLTVMSVKAVVATLLLLAAVQFPGCGGKSAVIRRDRRDLSNTTITDLPDEEAIRDFVRNFTKNLTDEDAVHFLEDLGNEQSSSFIFGSEGSFEDRLNEFVRRIGKTINNVAKKIRAIIDILRGNGDESGETTTDPTTSSP